MGAPQTLGEADRRLVAAWAADCAERVLGLFEAEVSGDGRPRVLIARAPHRHAAPAPEVQIDRRLGRKRLGRRAMRSRPCGRQL